MNNFPSLIIDHLFTEPILGMDGGFIIVED
jgi:hypothetical protein